MRQVKALGVVVMLVGLSGCADFFSGPTQQLSVVTTPKSGAQCVLANGEGSWSAKETPSVVAVERSSTPLNVSCATGDGWRGNETFQPSAAFISGDVAGDQYPAELSVALTAPPPDPSPAFGLDGGQNIALPDAPVAQPAASMRVQPAVQMIPAPGTSAISPAEADRARMADDNIVIRFQTLRVLLDEGLITREEYNSRRGANLGALLRYSIVPSARDLTRPAPPPKTLVDRLRYLAAAYAEHSISASEQAAERAVILDGLLPATFIRRADPPPPITDVMQLGAEIGRIERLRVANVITDSEAAREKAKASQLLDASIAAADAAARAAAGMAATQAAAHPNTGIGIALSTHNSQAQARRIWAGLQKAHPAELGQLGLSLKPIPRPHRPTHYQIVAGPLPDRDTAIGLCKSLRKSDLSCDAAVFGE